MAARACFNCQVMKEMLKSETGKQHIHNRQHVRATVRVTGTEIMNVMVVWMTTTNQLRLINLGSLCHVRLEYSLSNFHLFCNFVKVFLCLVNVLIRNKSFCGLFKKKKKLFYWIFVCGKKKYIIFSLLFLRSVEQMSSPDILFFEAFSFCVVFY